MSTPFGWLGLDKRNLAIGYDTGSRLQPNVLSHRADIVGVCPGMTRPIASR